MTSKLYRPIPEQSAARRHVGLKRDQLGTMAASADADARPVKQPNIGAMDAGQQANLAAFVAEAFERGLDVVEVAVAGAAIAYGVGTAPRPD
ncbi:MAG: hypothetical protein HND48_21895 [Chloroflexi bacterium]|nr:hypothetical protein [Chloroflexota bacterium]